MREQHTGRKGYEATGSKRSRISPHAWILVIGFVALLVAAVCLQKMEAVILAIYLIVSAVAFFLYACDKSAAQAQQWRVSEGMLLWTGLIGGWPGALLAQQAFRHKTRKLSFQIKFWLTVVLNFGLLWCQMHPEKVFAYAKQWLH